MRRPLRAENLPHEGLETMTRKVQWNSDALPYDQTLDQVLYEVRRSDAGESLLLDAVSTQDIIEDSDGALAFDALVTPYAKLERKMEVLQGVMVRSGESVKPVAMQVTEPFKQRGVANVAAIFELSDGQTVSIFFHNPDVTPNKMAASDEVISWKWLLNKKDITIVVAPERGEDLNIREVARRIIRLAEKNSPAFQRANGKRAERMQGIQTLKDEITSLESELAAAQHELEVAKVSAEDAQNRKNREYAEAVQRVNETGDAYIRAGENGGIDPKTGKTKEELRALSDSQAADAQRLKDIANGAPVKAPEFDPTSPEGYAQVTADESLQLKWQDRLDAFFQGRIVDVRNALRALGWGGDQGADLTKGEALTMFRYKTVGAGNNVVGMTATVYGVGPVPADFTDDLAGTAAEFAEKINAFVPAWFGGTNDPESETTEEQKQQLRDLGISWLLYAQHRLAMSHDMAVEKIVSESKSAQANAAKVGAGDTARKPDISYRNSADGLFTSFYPNTPEGEKAWNIINATPGAEGGKVLAAHAESTIKQLRDAGYTVAEDASAPVSAEEEAALLAELSKTTIPTVDVQNEAKITVNGNEYEEISLDADGAKRALDASVEKHSGNLFDAAKDVYQNTFKGRFVKTKIGNVLMTGLGWQENRQGLKRDAIRAKTIPFIPVILKNGNISTQELYKERSDGILKFHAFELRIDINDELSVDAVAKVGERADHSLFYHLSSSAVLDGVNEQTPPSQWKLRDIGGAVGGDVPVTLDSTLVQDGQEINLIILEVYDRKTGKRLTELEDDVGQKGSNPEKDPTRNWISGEGLRNLAESRGIAVSDLDDEDDVIRASLEKNDMRAVLESRFARSWLITEIGESYGSGFEVSAEVLSVALDEFSKAAQPTAPDIADSAPEIYMGVQLYGDASGVWHAREMKGVVMGDYAFRNDDGKPFNWTSKADAKAWIAAKTTEAAAAAAEGNSGAQVDYTAMFDPAVIKEMNVVKHLRDSALAAQHEGNSETVIESDRILSLFVDTLTQQQFKNYDHSKAEEVLFGRLHEIELEIGLGVQPNPQKEADRALFQSVIDGSIPDILAPELADSLEAAYYRQQTDPALVSLFEQAVGAYQNAMMAATAELA